MGAPAVKPPKPAAGKSPDPVLVVFGCDAGGKPQGAAFLEADAPDAMKAAEAAGLRTLSVSTDPAKRIAKDLPRGQMTGERLVLPRVKPEIYASLVTLAGPAPKASRSEAKGLRVVAGTEAKGSSPASKDKGGTDGEPHRPERWGDIKVGSVVLTEDTPKQGWFEAVVQEVMGAGVYRLVWQFWPHEAVFVRRQAQLALLPPKSAT